MKVALVYDRVNKIGGAEKVLLALHKIWPKAPLYTAVHQKDSSAWASDFKVIPSYLQKIPFFRSHHEILPLLTPSAFESFNFDEFDVVISVTSAEAKSIITKPATLHICYCLTPTRYLWSGADIYSENTGFSILSFLIKYLVKFFSPLMRIQDYFASQRPDLYLAISHTVKKRISKYYRKTSEVIFPPVDNRLFENKIGEGKYYLVVSRLVAYKRIDLIIKVFNDLKLPLKIVGTGNQLNALKKASSGNVEFLGQVGDASLAKLYASCTALIIAAREDFGITSLEAQACGKPVIAFGKAGIKETVIDHKTGILFSQQTEEDLKLAITKFKRLQFKPSDCHQNARKYSQKIFIDKFSEFVKTQWKIHRL